MPEFPERKHEQLVLCAEVAAGIAANPTEFPNPPFNDVMLSGLVAMTISKITVRVAKEAELKQAIDEENEVHELTIKLCKQYLAEAEARYANESAILKKLGWDVKSEPRHLEPGQVRNLEVAPKGPGIVLLDWKAPARTKSVGSTSGYRIERQIIDIQTRNVTEEWGQWQTSCYATEEVLHEQPRAVEISYRIVATNRNGDGPASDVETIVL